MLQFIILMLKGGAMGAANVIPGVSGGTIAFITGIYERLLGALKSIDLEALRLLLRFRIKDFLKHIDFYFLFPLLLGVVLSIFTVAELLRFCFARDEILTWAFFFGLIIASVLLVGRKVRNWSIGVVISLLIGVCVAVFIALQKPVEMNSSFLYLVLCGVVAFCSMILPGLSGSFILVLMGNYLLILNSISDLRGSLVSSNFSKTVEIFSGIILPVGIGAVLGFVFFSHFLSWLFKKAHDATVGLLTGFIAGSLLIIWPWKSRIYLLGDDGEKILRKGEEILSGYKWEFPSFDFHTFLAIFVILLGFLCVYIIGKFSRD